MLLSCLNEELCMHALSGSEAEQHGVINQSDAEKSIFTATPWSCLFEETLRRFIWTTL